MKRPKVTTKCVADEYAAPNERIIEFSCPDGRGGLISLCDIGEKITVSVYCTTGVVVCDFAEAEK